MKKALEWLGIGAAVLVAALLVCAAVVYAASNRVLTRRYAPPVSWISLPDDSATVARGAHLARAIAKCANCHAEDLGGGVVIDDPTFMRLAAPNLTRGRGGVAASLSDRDWVRAVQHGVAPDGRGLILMPAEAYIHLADDDLAAILAWVRQVPPVDRELPPRTVGPVARLLFATRRLPLIAAAYIEHGRPNVVAPARDTTSEYGRYLALTGGCVACHGPALSGGPVPGAPPRTPPAANLTPGGIGAYTEQDFFRALREGKRPGGQELNAFMPWRFTKLMTDEEIRAVWSYLRTLPAKELGQR